MIDEGFRTTHHNLLKLFQFGFVAQATYTFCCDWSILLFIYHVLIAAVIGRGLSDPRRWGPSGSNGTNNSTTTTPTSTTSNENNTTSTSQDGKNKKKKSEINNNSEKSTSSPSPSSLGGHPDYETQLNLRSQEGMYNVRMRIAKTVLCCIVPVVAHVYLFYPNNMMREDDSSSSSNQLLLFSASFTRQLNYLRNVFASSWYSNNSSDDYSSYSYFRHQTQENMELQSRIMSSSVMQYAFAVDRCGLLWMLWLDFVKAVLAFAMLSVDCHDHAFCLDLSR